MKPRPLLPLRDDSHLNQQIALLFSCNGPIVATGLTLDATINQLAPLDDVLEVEGWPATVRAREHPEIIHLAEGRPG